jgi:hypothetical protein
MEAFAPLVCRLPATRYASAIAEVLQLSTLVRRAQLLAALAASAAALHHVAGEAAIRDTARAIVDVTEWWP